MSPVQVQLRVVAIFFSGRGWIARLCEGLPYNRAAGVPPAQHLWFRSARQSVVEKVTAPAKSHSFQVVDREIIDGERSRKVVEKKVACKNVMRGSATNRTGCGADVPR
jgi:hypothetical protein